MVYLDSEPLQLNCPGAVAHVQWVYVYSVVTISTYSPGIIYSYQTLCSTPYLQKRSLSNDQASISPGVVGVARAIGIMIVLLGLLIYYLLSASLFL